MTNIVRYSPIRFDANVSEVEIRNGWQVVRRYQGQGQGPHLIDLSHLPRWDIQGKNLADICPFGMDMPDEPGAVFLSKGCLISRLNDTQCQAWWLATEKIGRPDDIVQATEVTDGQAVLALIGSQLEILFETLVSLDLFRQDIQLPWLFQGPLLGLPCQIIRLGKVDNVEAVLIAMPRGYGQAMAEEILKLCRPFGLTPAGESKFFEQLERNS